MRRSRRDATSGPLRFAMVLFACVSFASTATAQSEKISVRGAAYEWNSAKNELSASFSFRDVVDAKIRRKLSRGLPTTIVLTGTVFRVGIDKPVSTTAQTCKITWHVWNEAYRLEITRPGGNRTRWTTTLSGVLRRCAEARRLLVATRHQVLPGTAVYLRAKVQVNPISQKLLQKIKRWVSRPARTGTAAPGDALFSTFTGLFMQRIGAAERELQFITTTAVPKVRAAKSRGQNEG